MIGQGAFTAERFIFATDGFYNMPVSSTAIHPKDSIDNSQLFKGLFFNVFCNSNNSISACFSLLLRIYEAQSEKYSHHMYIWLNDVHTYVFQIIQDYDITQISEVVVNSCFNKNKLYLSRFKNSPKEPNLSESAFILLAFSTQARIFF